LRLAKVQLAAQEPRPRVPGIAGDRLVERRDCLVVDALGVEHHAGLVPQLPGVAGRDVRDADHRHRERLVDMIPAPVSRLLAS
jgi:hypothetical protein